MKVFPSKGLIEFTEEQMKAVAEEFKKMYQCRRCKTDMGFNHRDKAYCWKCLQIIEEEKLNENLDNIRDLYTLEERLRMVEKFIIQHQKGHPQKDWVMR
jgi:hypothetical protein